MSWRVVWMECATVDSLAMRPDWKERLSDAVVVLAIVAAFAIAFAIGWSGR